MFQPTPLKRRLQKRLRLSQNDFIALKGFKSKLVLDELRWDSAIIERYFRSFPP